MHIFVSGGPLNNAEVFYNKVLTTGNGIGLYSRDYDTATKNPISAYNVVLTPTSDSKSELTLPGEMTLKVTKIVENTASCPIPANGFVLSIAEKSAYSSALSSLKAVQVGDTLTFSALCDDMWKGIAYACGGGDLLVEDGEALSDFTLDTKDEQRARTAIGRKSDGTLVIYTADESSNSAGIDLYDLAEKMAELGNENRFVLPRPLCNSNDCNMSFSGLKTAVRKIIESYAPDNNIEHAIIRKQDIADICAGFQLAATECLIHKLKKAIVTYKTKYPQGKDIVVSGGVASNTYLRRKLQELADLEGLAFSAPPIKFCTDNGVMIAWAGMERALKGMYNDLDFKPRPRWPLDENAPKAAGAGGVKA